MEDKPSVHATSLQTYEVLPTLFLVLQGFLSRDFVPGRRSPACLIPHFGWTRTSSPFTLLRIGRAESRLLASSYRMDEDMLSFRTTSYLTDEFPPTRFLVPNGQGQVLLSCDVILEGRSAACLIPHTRQMGTSPPFAQLRTGRTKSSLCDSLYRMD